MSENRENGSDVLVIPADKVIKVNVNIKVDTRFTSSSMIIDFHKQEIKQMLFSELRKYISVKSDVKEDGTLCMSAQLLILKDKDEL